MTGPDIVLDGTSGLRRLRPSAGHRLLVIFYEEDNTPTCSTQVSSFKEDFDILRELDAEVVAISSDPIPSHQAFADRLGGMPFPLLSDPDGLAAKGFAVWDEQIHRAHRSVFVLSDRGEILHAAPHYSPANLAEYEHVFRALGLSS